jgi:hypothetical protein
MRGLGAKGAILRAQTGFGVDDGAGEDPVFFELGANLVSAEDEVFGMHFGKDGEFAGLFKGDDIPGLF